MPAGRLWHAPGAHDEYWQLAIDVPEARPTWCSARRRRTRSGVNYLPRVHRAQIVLADEPCAGADQAAAKRRLWNALRSVRRALATMEH